LSYCFCAPITPEYILNYCCPVKNKNHQKQSKFLDNQVYDFVFQKASPLIKKELSLPRRTRAGPAKSRGGGAVNGRAGGIFFALIFWYFCIKTKVRKEKKSKFL